MRLPTAVALCLLAGALHPSYAETPVPRTPARLARMILAADWPKVAEEAEAWKATGVDPYVPNCLVNFANAQMGQLPATFESGPEMVQTEAKIEGTGDSFSVKFLLRTRDSVETPAGPTAQVLCWAKEFARRHPDNIPALSLLTNAHILSSDFKSALEVAGKAVALGPTSALAACMRGTGRGAANQPEAAIADFARAIELDPSYPKPLTFRGQVYYNQGRYDLAVADFTRLLELTPGNVVAYMQRGQAYQGRGLLNEALQDFTKLVELHPEWGFGYLFRALCHKAAEDYDAALDDCNQTLSVAPNWSAGLLFRGIIAHAAGDTDAAIRDYSAYIDSGAGVGPAPWVVLAMSLMEVGRDEEAEKAFSQFVRLAPKAGLKNTIPAARRTLSMLREDE